MDDLKTTQQLNQELAQRIETLERLLGLKTVTSRRRSRHG